MAAGRALSGARSTSLRTSRWARGVCDDMLKLAAIRGPNMQGHRELGLFVFLNYKLIGGRVRLSSLNRRKKMGSIFGEDIGRECKSSVSGLWKKWTSTKAVYTYKRATLINLFSVTGEEAGHMKMLKPRTPVMRKKQIDDGAVQAREMYQAGLKKSEIARKLGVVGIPVARDR